MIVLKAKELESIYEGEFGGPIYYGLHPLFTEILVNYGYMRVTDSFGVH
jgi:hypothetical protein